jgi:hypothetical protein
MKTTLGLLLFVISVSGISIAAQQSTAPSTTSPQAFTLRLSTGNETIKSGSELKVDIILTNTSRQTIVWSRWVGGPDYSFKIDVRDAQSKLAPFNERYRGLLRGKDLPMGSSRHYGVGPGETSKESAIVNDQYDLSALGTYTIQAHRFDEVSKTDVKSNTITVTVAP